MCVGVRQRVLAPPPHCDVSGVGVSAELQQRVHENIKGVSLPFSDYLCDPSLFTTLCGQQLKSAVWTFPLLLLLLSAVFTTRDSADGLVFCFFCSKFLYMEVIQVYILFIVCVCILA